MGSTTGYLYPPLKNSLIQLTACSRSQTSPRAIRMKQIYYPPPLLLTALLIIFILTGLPSNTFSQESEEAIGTFTIDDINHNHKTFILKPEYLEQKISTSYFPGKISGTLAKSLVSFSFFGKTDHVYEHNPVLSKVTYVLNGEADYWNHQNTISKGISYITHIETSYKVGEKNTFSIENLLQAQNEGAKKLGVPILTRDQVGLIQVDFHIWFNPSGDISVTHSGWEKYFDRGQFKDNHSPPTVPTFLMVWLITFLFSILLCLAGDAFLQETWVQKKEYPVALRVGLSFFIGVPLYLVLYKFFGRILPNTQVAFFITFFLLALFAAFGIRRALKLNTFPAILFPATTIVSATTLLLALNIFVILHWTDMFSFPTILPSGGANIRLHQFVGSLHSGFYTNIATYVFESKNMPVLGMNHSQSLLASGIMFLGFNNPFLALATWLGVSIFYLAILGYGLFRYFNFRVFPAIMGAFILLCGNFSLSLSHVLTIDSGSPWILCGYTDTILSFGTLFSFLYIAYSTYKNNIPVFKSLAVAGIIGASWNWFGPQNLVLMAPLAALLLLLILRKKIAHPKSIRMIRFGVAYALFAVVGLTQGGMLTPHQFLDNNNIPGVHRVDPTVAISHFSFDQIYLPHFFRGLGPNYWTPGLNPPSFTPTVLALGEMNLGKIKDTLANGIFLFEARLWTALRVAFFPILGLVMLGRLVYKHRREKDQVSEDSEIKWNALNLFWWVTSIIFLGGFFITYIFIVGGMKWELSRFMILGHNLGQVAFILSIHEYMKSIPSIRKNNLLWSCLALFMTFGPFLMTSIHLSINVFSDPAGALERFRVVVFSSGMVQ